MVKTLETNRIIELVNDKYIRTHISASESITIVNKKRVFSGTAKHFTHIYEKDVINDYDSKELYYPLEEGKELPLNTFRLVAKDKKGKQVILDGLLELLLLVSEGKIYNIELNPLNFIVEDKPEINKVRVKAFYREDRGLREITDKWLEDAKKIIGYFLLSDTGYNEINYNTLKPVDFYQALRGAVADQYLKIMRSSSIDQMAREWFTDSAYQQIKSFPPIMKDYRKPSDITTVASSNLGDDLVKQADEFKDIMNERREDIWEKDKEEEERVIKKKKGKKKGNKGFKGLFYLLFILLMGWIIFNSVGNVKVSEDLYNGIMRASVKDYESAYNSFKNLDEKDLEKLKEEEKLILFDTYMNVGEYEKALSINPDGVETLITFLEDNRKLGEVVTIKSNLDPIVLEQSIISKDYETVIELGSLVNVSDRRAIQITKAYVMTGNIKGAVEYVNGSELKDAKKIILKFYEEYKKENKVTKEENNSIMKEIDKVIVR